MDRREVQQDGRDERRGDQHDARREERPCDAAAAADALAHELAGRVRAAGFECVGTTEAARLEVRLEVRAMCASGSCHMFGKNWACPPACSELDHFARIIAAHRTALVFQTVAELEDEFDGETMMEAEQLHKRRTEALADALAADGLAPARVFVLSAGTCARCMPCAYPEPCRFPDKRLVSMEAAGLLVTDVCTAANIPYNHGSLTIAYTSCLLV